MAAEDVAGAVARIALGAPVNGVVEIAGPQKFRLDELVRRWLKERHDPREVITDSHARVYGIELGERILLPGDDARLGETRFDDWLSQTVASTPLATRS